MRDIRSSSDLRSRTPEEAASERTFIETARRGLISYHFAGKDDLIRQVVHDVVEQGVAYMRPRIIGASTGPAMLRAYIASNLAFMRQHRQDMIAILEITRSADGRRIFQDDPT